jgi:hypothetical protein
MCGAQIEVNVYAGIAARLHTDTHSANHSADLSKGAKVDERTLVKNGLSVAAGAGETSFGTGSVWRAGETYVAPAPGLPLVASLVCYYRDSFFMLLREDTCCHGACAAAAKQPATAADFRAASDALGQSGGGGSGLREKIVRERETREALARKRPKDEGAIDLTGDDD